MVFMISSIKITELNHTQENTPPLATRQGCFTEEPVSLRRLFHRGGGFTEKVDAGRRFENPRGFAGIRALSSQRAPVDQKHRDRTGHHARYRYAIEPFAEQPT